MKETELKPCPFCGGEAELHKSKLYLCDAVQIHCKKCSVHTPKEVFNHLHYSEGKEIYVTQTMAIERVVKCWNRRADMSKEKKRKYYRKCGCCGKRFEQSLLTRTNKSPNGWFCCDCYVDFQIAEHPEYDIEEW